MRKFTVILILSVLLLSGCLTTTISHTSGNLKTIIEMQTSEGTKIFVLDDGFSGYINEYGELIVSQ